MDNETAELPEALIALRDEYVKLIGVYENAALAQVDALAQIANRLIHLELNQVKLEAKLEILEGGKNV